MSTPLTTRPPALASRQLLQAGRKVLVDKKDLWDGFITRKPGQFPTTILIVTKKFAADHPQPVTALLQGNEASANWLNTASAADTSTAINAALKATADSTLPSNVIDRSLKNISFTVDPLAGTYRRLFQDGVDAGITKPADINSIFDLLALNGVTGKTSAGGLGQEPPELNRTRTNGRGARTAKAQAPRVGRADSAPSRGWIALESQ